MNIPLIGPAPTEILLTNPPLVQVIAQVRFSPIFSIEEKRFIASFQEAIREQYPGSREEQNHNVILGSDKAFHTRSEIIWRFYDVSGFWHITLAPSFLALETTKYTNRNNFLQRFSLVLKALKKHINPYFITRLGVRYIDRIFEEKIKILPLLIRSEVLGILGLGTPFTEYIQHSISENMFMLPDNAGQLNAHWGLIPANETIDSKTIKAIDKLSWILDLDAFQTKKRTLEVDVILKQTRYFAERIYSVFRWAVTDEFLRQYGGKL